MSVGIRPLLGGSHPFNASRFRPFDNRPFFPPSVLSLTGPGRDWRQLASEKIAGKLWGCEMMGETWTGRFSQARPLDGPVIDRQSHYGVHASFPALQGWWIGRGW
jgi:hypothetical protein